MTLATLNILHCHNDIPRYQNNFKVHLSIYTGKTQKQFENDKLFEI